MNKPVLVRAIRNNLENKNMVKNHVLEFFEDENSIVSQIDYMMYEKTTIYKECVRIVEGGSLLISNYDMEEELKKYSQPYKEEEIFDLYVNTMAKGLENIYLNTKYELHKY